MSSSAVSIDRKRTRKRKRKRKLRSIDCVNRSRNVSRKR